MVSCQKGPIRHAYAWQIGPICQITLDMVTFLIGYSPGTSFVWLTQMRVWLIAGIHILSLPVVQIVVLTS